MHAFGLAMLLALPNVATDGGTCYKRVTMTVRCIFSAPRATSLLVAVLIGMLPCCPRSATECAANRDCDQGEICVEHACRVVCNSSAVCLHTEVCQNGVCTAVSDAAIGDGSGDDGHRLDAEYQDAPTADRMAMPDHSGADSSGRDDWAADSTHADTTRPDTAGPDTAQADAWLPECAYDTDCEDHNACTANTCDTVHGRCSYPALGDTVACTTDNNECTLDHCDGYGRCLHDPEIGSACTDDNNPCTLDQCNALGGCDHPVTDGAACPDEPNECTSDRCVGSTCTHTAKTRGTACSAGACCGGVCTRLDTVDNCGGCGIYCEDSYACVNVPGYTSHHTCKCIGYMNCRRGGYGDAATCYDDPSAGWICLCQCGAVAQCSGQCGGGATCTMTAGNNYCGY